MDFIEKSRDEGREGKENYSENNLKHKGNLQRFWIVKERGKDTYNCTHKGKIWKKINL